MELDNKNKKEEIKNKSNSSNDSVLNLLIEIPFMKLLPIYTIQDICRLISIKTYKKNEFVLKQGDPISNLYIVKSGSFLCTINRLSSSNISHDINSFAHYQNITNEPFLEERKYELKGKITNNEEIPLFIYHKQSFFGDVELVTGKTQSSFTIQANEDESVLCYIDRNKWIKFTKRLRIPFTRVTIDKLNRINERILDIIKRKNKMDIDKIKMYTDKINYQLEVNDNYDYYAKKIEEKEQKLQEELEKFKSKRSLKLKEKAKSLKNFQYNKKYILDIFKYPNILKNETKNYLEKYMNNSHNKKDIRKVKLIKTKSLFDMNQDTNKSIQLSNNKSLLYRKKNLKNSDFLKSKSKLFLTNTIKSNKLKNNSMNDIFISYGKNNNNKYNSLIEQKNSTIISRNQNSFVNNSSLINMDESKFKNFSNLIIKNIFNKNKKISSVTADTTNQENNNKNKKVKILQYEGVNKNNSTIPNFSIKTLNNSMYIANKEEKMSLEKINFLLKEKYNSSKNNIMDKILGKYKSNSFLD